MQDNTIKRVAICHAVDKIAEQFALPCGTSSYELVRGTIEHFERDRRASGIFYDVARDGKTYAAHIKRDGRWSVWPSVEAYELNRLARSSAF